MLIEVQDVVRPADGGVETDLIFNHGVDIPHFVAHTLLQHAAGRVALTGHFEGFLDLADHHDVGFIMDTQTWKAHPHWASDLGATDSELRDANHDAVAFIAGLRDARATGKQLIVLNALIGPRGDAYAPDQAVAAGEAERYHGRQLGWLAETDVDMVTAMTFTQARRAKSDACHRRYECGCGSDPAWSCGLGRISGVSGRRGRRCWIITGWVAG